MAAGSARAGKAYIELGVRSKLTAGLNAAARRIDAFGARVRRVGTLMAGIGVGATAGLVAASRSFASAGAEIRDLSIRLGIGAETLSRLNYAAAQAGANFQGVAKGIGRLARVTSDAGRGLETYQRTFRDLGIDIAQFQQLSLEDQFLTAGTALSKITDESKRAAIAQELFGRSGLELIPIFEDGAASVRAFFDEADRLGVTISDEEAKSAKALDDAYTRVTRTLQRVAAAVGEALAPELTSIANNLADNIANIRRFLKANKDAIVGFAKLSVGVAAAGAALVTFGYAISGAAVAIKAAVLVFNPFTLGLGALVGAITLFGSESKAALQGIGNDFEGLKTDASSAIEGIKTAIANGNFEVAGDIAMVGLELAFERGLGSIQRLWNGWIDDLAIGLIELETALSTVFRNSDTAIGAALTGVGMAVGNEALVAQGFGFAQRGGAFDPGISEERDARVAIIESQRAARERQLQRRLEGLANRLEELRREIAVPRPAPDEPQDRGSDQQFNLGDDVADRIANAVATGTQQTENLRTMTRGTFSAFAAGRINSAMDQVQREQLSQLKAIARNTSTATGQVYTP